MNRSVLGGAGFLGSNLCHRLLEKYPNDRILVYDNFSSGKREFLDDIFDHDNLDIIIGDINDLSKLTAAMEYIDEVTLVASNPDISKAIKDPTIDFYQGTMIVQNCLEAMRINNVKRLKYVSGSGIYGSFPKEDLKEDHAPMLPISPYGANKLASESLICAYSYMFEINATCYRPANIVGKNMTHSVTKDFVNQLILHPEFLNVMGNGKQKKHYVYVEDVIDAIININNVGFNYFNVSTQDHLTVVEIADIIIGIMKLKDVKINYSSNESKGWLGDIGTVNLNTEKIRSLGWNNKYTSREAIMMATKYQLEENGKTI